MTDRRSFLKSLALLGSAAVGCPGIFLPKFEPVKWKTIITPECVFNPKDFCGKWQFVMNEVFAPSGLPFSHAVMVSPDKKSSIEILWPVNT